MSELEPSTGHSHESARTPHDDDFSGEPDDRPEREGLPRTYRMRADSHYVDQLESRYPGPAVRLIPTRQIEMADLSSAAGLAGLASSIKAYGILQPLLVRRRTGRYQLIAGCKRLAAAVSVGLTEVPCVVHDVDETTAAALADADNLRATALDPVPPPASPDWLHEVLRALSYDLAGMGSLVACLRPAGASVLQHHATADLLQAQVWRAAWLAGAAALVTSPYRPGRPKPIGSMFERIRTGLDAEARLTGLRLDLYVAPDAPTALFDENLAVAITGLIFATLTWLQGFEAPRIELRADVAGPGTVKLQVVQRIAAVPADASQYFRSAAPMRTGELAATLGLLTARRFAEACRGTIELTGIGKRGSVIQTVLSEPPVEPSE